MSTQGSMSNVRQVRQIYEVEFEREELYVYYLEYLISLKVSFEKPLHEFLSVKGHNR